MEGFSTGFLSELEGLSIEEANNHGLTTHEEAMALGSPQAERWKVAMKSEYHSLLENGTFQAFEEFHLHKKKHATGMVW